VAPFQSHTLVFCPPHRPRHSPSAAGGHRERVRVGHEHPDGAELGRRADPHHVEVRPEPQAPDGRSARVPLILKHREEVLSDQIKDKLKRSGAWLISRLPLSTTYGCALGQGGLLDDRKESWGGKAVWLPQPGKRGGRPPHHWEKTKEFSIIFARRCSLHGRCRGGRPRRSSADRALRRTSRSASSAAALSPSAGRSLLRLC